MSPEVNHRRRPVEERKETNLSDFVERILSDTELKRRKIVPKEEKITAWKDRWIQDGFTEDQLIRHWEDAVEWLCDNPKKKRTSVPRYFNNWINKEKQKKKGFQKSESVASMYLPGEKSV